MDTVDGVLPLVRADVERATLLLDSLERFFTGFGRLFVIVPDAHRDAVESAWGSRSGLRLEILPESEVAPELATSRARGWFKQQLVKLAIYERVQTPFFLTFDADVVATRSVAPGDLVSGGRGLAHVIPEDLHPDWYRGTERLLARPLVRKGILHGVTPALLARDAVAAMVRALERRSEEGPYARGVAGLAPAPGTPPRAPGLAKLPARRAPMDRVRPLPLLARAGRPVRELPS